MSKKSVKIFAESLERYMIMTMLMYGNEVAYEVNIALNEVAEEAKERVKAASPKRTGKYKRGWRVDFKSKGGLLQCIVHQSGKEYRLTHLLENGHGTRLGKGRNSRRYGTKSHVAAQPHIAEVNDWAQRELEQRIRKAIGGG